MINIEETLHLLNVDIRFNRGEWVDCICPIHAERKPSFSINLETGQWVCRHDNAGGRDIVSLVAKIKSLTNKEAFNWVKLNSTVRQTSSDDLLNLVLNKKISDISDFAAWSELYNNLDKTVMAEYWFERGFTEKIMHKFEARYDPMWKAIVLPIKDEASRTIAFVERSLRGGSGPKYMYNKGFTRVLYPLNYFSGDTAILVEGSLDAIWLHQNEIYGGLCTFGAGVTLKQSKWLRANVRNVVLCFDNDDAGRKATTQAFERLAAMNVTAVEIPKHAKDVQELSKEELKEVFKL